MTNEEYPDVAENIYFNPPGIEVSIGVSCRTEYHSPQIPFVAAVKATGDWHVGIDRETMCLKIKTAVSRIVNEHIRMVIPEEYL